MSVKIGSDVDRTVEGAIRTLEGEPTTLSPGAALAVLAEHAAGEDDQANRTKATRALTAALAKHSDPQVRVGAAGVLGAVASPAAVRALRSTVERTDDGQVLAAAAHALARSGTKADVARLLDGSKRTGWKVGQRRAQIAARLLSHRVGAPVDLDDSALLLDNEDGATLPKPRRGFRLRLVEVSSVVDDVHVPPTERHLVADGATAVGAFVCGPRQHVVMAPVGHDEITRLATQPGIAATLFGVNESTREPFVRWIVLTHPTAGTDSGGDKSGRISVTVVRRTGEVGFVGHGSVDDGVLRVELSSVEVPGSSALSLAGTLSRDGLTIKGISDTKITVPRRVPVGSPIVDTA